MTALDVRAFGAVGPGVDSAPALNAALRAASVPGGAGELTLPAGRIDIGSEIALRASVALTGCGGGDAATQPATELRPLPGYTGAALHHLPAGPYLWHFGSVRRLRVRGFASHGIHIEGGMGECSVIDEVICSYNGGDGIRIEGPSTPVMLGRVDVVSNGGAGLRLIKQNQTHVQVLYLAGENNGESLMTVDTADFGTAIRVLGWKSERYGPAPGNPTVFLLRNLNGAIVDLGMGRIQIGSHTPLAPGAIVQQVVSGGTRGRVSWTAVMGGAGAAQSYTDGYRDEAGAFPVADCLRQPCTVGLPVRALR